MLVLVRCSHLLIAWSLSSTPVQSLPYTATYSARFEEVVYGRAQKCLRLGFKPPGLLERDTWLQATPIIPSLRISPSHFVTSHRLLPSVSCKLCGVCMWPPVSPFGHSSFTCCAWELAHFLASLCARRTLPHHS